MGLTFNSLKIFNVMFGKTYKNKKYNKLYVLQFVHVKIFLYVVMYAKSWLERLACPPDVHVNCTFGKGWACSIIFVVFGDNVTESS